MYNVYVCGRTRTHDHRFGSQRLILSRHTGRQNNMYMSELSENDVKNIILSLKNSAAGWDNFPIFMAKQCIDGYISPLTSIINKAITQSVFARELKLARVMPIVKSGDKQDVSNYRPISILTFFAKVFEKILYHNVSNFFDRNDSIHENQWY